MCRSVDRTVAMQKSKGMRPESLLMRVLLALFYIGEGKSSALQKRCQHLRKAVKHDKILSALSTLWERSVTSNMPMVC